MSQIGAALSVLANVAYAVLPFGLIGAGVGMAYGLPFGLISVGAVLWIDDLLPSRGQGG